MSTSGRGQRVYRVDIEDLIRDCALDGGLDQDGATLIDARPVEDSKHELMIQLAEVDDD